MDKSQKSNMEMNKTNSRKNTMVEIDLYKKFKHAKQCYIQ